MTDTWPHRGRLRPWVMGHRGTRLHAIENTVNAFEHAMAHGADGVELDVRLSLDEVLVVMHDSDLTRVTNGRDTRLVAQLTAQELGQIDLGEGVRIPTLHEVLIWAANRGALLNIELKWDKNKLRALARGISWLCHEVYPKHCPKLVLSSFHVGLLLYLKALGVKHLFAWLTEHQQTHLKYAPLAALLGLSGVHPEHVVLDAKHVTEWHHDGLFVSTWTVNGDDEIRRATELGADVLISDDPERVRKIVS